jgi:hypothetical protein
MTQTVHSPAAAAEHAAGMAMTALHKALAPGVEQVTAAVETQLQNALHLLRSCPEGRAQVARLEAIALHLRVLAQARRDGLPNLYASRLARLRRVVFH